MNAKSARATARQELETTRRAKFAERLAQGGTLCDAEARSAGFKNAAQAIKALTK